MFKTDYIPFSSLHFFFFPFYLRYPVHRAKHPSTSTLNNMKEHESIMARSAAGNRTIDLMGRAIDV